MPAYACLSDRGGVTSQIHLATVEGLRILEKGGNAFDAAIGVSAVLTVLMPNASSIGGDGFMLAVSNGSELVAYNGSGKSPKGFSAREYVDKKPLRGPLTITVPGLVELWEWTNENYGSVDLGLLLRRAASLARNGFYLQESLAGAIESSKPVLARYGDWNKIFGSRKIGSYINFPRLARIYGCIARRGADAYYRSKLTEDIVDELQEYGVPIAYEDFSEHKGERVTPIRCEYGDHELYELPPNTQGLSTLQLLKAAEVAEINKLSFRNHERIEKFLKLAMAVYEDRDRWIADPQCFNIPVDKLLSPSYLRMKLCQRGDNQSCLDSNDTTFFVVADRYGNFVGFIQSIFRTFGSGIVVHDIPFQCRGSGFARNLRLPNSPASRKRPMHTLSILLARLSNQDDYLIGCSGGDLRPQIHAEVFINAVDYKMPLAKAVDLPRYVLTSWRKKQIEAIIEDGVLGLELPDWANRVAYPSPETGVVQAARKRHDGIVEFVADPRGGGVSVPVL